MPNPDSPSHGPQSDSNEIVVFMVRQDGQCSECGKGLFEGVLLRMEKGRPLCLDCADLGDLEFLPSGNAALTRRTSRHARLRAVVVRWSRARKRYERQGILAPPEAIERAEAECLADEEQRARARDRAAVRREGEDREYEATVAARLKDQFPGCPPGEAEEIAAWTCRKHSGRVGRSAAAKELEPQALRLAVIAHIRHEHTRYDELLMEHGDRLLARSMIAGDVDQMVRRWEQGLAR